MLIIRKLIDISQLNHFGIRYGIYLTGPFDPGGRARILAGGVRELGSGWGRVGLRLDRGPPRA